MRIFLFLLCYHILPFYVYGSGWSQLNGPEGGYVSKLTILDGAIIASANDVIWYHSTDSGYTWQQIGMLPFRDNFIKYSAIVDSVIIVGTQYGILRSTNFGFSWEPDTIDAEFDNNLTQFITSGKIIFAKLRNSSGSMDSTLYRSDDYGISWLKIQLPGLISIKSMFNTSLGLLAISYGKIFLSDDSGKVWTEYRIPLEENEGTYSVSVIGERIIVGTTSRILFSDDMGITWTQSGGGIPEGTIYYKIVTMGSKLYMQIDTSIYQSTDGSVSWSHFATPSGVQLDNFIADGENIIYTKEGIGCSIYTSTDGGSTWNQTVLQTEYSPRENGVAVLGRYFYFISLRGIIYRSDDGGKSFKESFNGMVNRYIYSLEKTDSRFFAGTANGLFYKDLNSNSWKFKPMPNGRYLPYSSCYGVSRCQSDILVSDGFGCYRSSDNGNTWENISWGRNDFPIQYTPFFSIGSSCYHYQNYFKENDTVWHKIDSSIVSTHIADFAESNGYYFVAGDSGVSRSADGIHWDRVLWTNTYCLGVGEKTIYTGCSDSRFFTLTDNGNAWKLLDTDLLSAQPEKRCSFVAPSQNRHATSIAVYENQLFVSYDLHNSDCALYNAYHSVDSGVTWVSLSTKIPYAVNRFERFGNDLYAATQGGGIWHLDLEELSASSPKTSLFTSKTVTLDVRSFNAIFRIIYTIPKQCDVSISLYSIDGKKIADYFNGTLDPGSHIINIDAAQLPKGCFLLSMKAGSSSITKKVYLY